MVSTSKQRSCCFRETGEEFQVKIYPSDPKIKTSASLSPRHLLFLCFQSSFNMEPNAVGPSETNTEINTVVLC